MQTTIGIFIICFYNIAVGKCIGNSVSFIDSSTYHSPLSIYFKTFIVLYYGITSITISESLFITIYSGVGYPIYTSFCVGFLKYFGELFACIAVFVKLFRPVTITKYFFVCNEISLIVIAVFIGFIVSSPLRACSYSFDDTIMAIIVESTYLRSTIWGAVFAIFLMGYGSESSIFYTCIVFLL